MEIASASYAAISTHVQNSVASRLKSFFSVSFVATPYDAGQPLVDAMLYGSAGAGKRLRPTILWLTAHLFPSYDMLDTLCLDAGVALEFIHCYSLIHDDLPALDNDSLRRGNPSCHVAFSEGMAILAGDGLLTKSFDVLAHLPCPAPVALRLVGQLSRLSGAAGMVLGQAADMDAMALPPAHLSIDDHLAIASLKTGALFQAAVVMGAILSSVSDDDLAPFADFGRLLGTIYQLVDDRLDTVGSAAVMGKAVGKDSSIGKRNIMTDYGDSTMQQVIADAHHRLLQAYARLPKGATSDGIRTFIQHVVERVA